MSLKPATIPSNGTESGDIFYPVKNYQDLQAVVGNAESRTSVAVTNQVPWLAGRYEPVGFSANGFLKEYRSAKTCV